MGHIAPGRNKKCLFFFRWLKYRTVNSGRQTLRINHKTRDAPQKRRSTLRSVTSDWANMLWHWPDNISWMAPLPFFHRRGIIIATLVVLVAILWPEPTLTVSTERSVTLNGDNQRQQPASSNRPIQQRSATATPEQWHSFQISPGQTMAQLFRDNSLPVNDLFAMVQVEGADRPLSNLHAGQAIKIRKNARGELTGLTLENDDGPVLFTRQSDGSFLRAR